MYYTSCGNVHHFPPKIIYVFVLSSQAHEYISRTVLSSTYYYPPTAWPPNVNNKRSRNKIIRYISLVSNFNEVRKERVRFDTPTDVHGNEIGNITGKARLL